MTALPQLEIVRDPARAAAMMHPVRLRILHELKEPQSASSIGRHIDLPRQQVNYHLRELEKEGFLSFVEERRKGNCLERIVQATAQSYLISPEALGELGPTPEAQRDRFSAAYLVSAAARVIRDLAVLGLRARKASKRLSTLTLETEVRFRTAADRSAFSEELASTLARLAARYHDASSSQGRAFRFVVGAYPAITKQQDDEPDGAQLS
ncbi:helix-turn-helix domain-containing protein [uncultured Paludibaculum sp.]|uniref:helix-turn-helix domain-containing protein n=1 Tax=uncultured Paludibaculum sp. TaxID=1765020 RepID=UPI002AAAC765|nr:helix-turn-helix domain-containing protein [uncultured Paludibaculum sp.]